jgi:alpha-beta hydrolase superfamily lysophospholipase
VGVGYSDRRAGLKDVSVKLYEGVRHALLKELNKDKVIADMVRWLNDHYPSLSWHLRIK